MNDWRSLVGFAVLVIGAWFALGPLPVDPGAVDAAGVLVTNDAAVRPVATAWWRFELAWFPAGSGGFRISAIVLLAACGWLLYELTVQLSVVALSVSGFGKRAWSVHIGAFLAALLFTVHPLRVEATVWPARHGVLLGLILLLLSLLAYVESTRSRRWLWLLLSLAAYVLALLCGPQGVVLPLLLIVLDAHPLRRLRVVTLLEKLPFAVVASVALLVALGAQSDLPLYASATAEQRAAATAYSAVFNVWKTVWPVALAPAYEMGRRLQWLSIEYGGAAALVVVALVAAGAVARRAPGVAAALAAYVLAIVGTVWVAQPGWALASDALSAWPLVPLYVLLGGALAWLCAQRGASLRVAVVAVVTVALAAAVLLGVLTRLQVQRWHDAEALWQAARQAGWDGGITYYELGRLAETRALDEQARNLYGIAVRTNPRLLPASDELGQAWVAGLDAEQAVAVHTAALKIDPQRARTHFLLGCALAAAGRPDEAEEALRAALRLSPEYAEAHTALGQVWLSQERCAEAAEQFELAAKAKPGDADAAYDLGRAWLCAGETERAKQAFSDAMTRDPSHELARRALEDLPR